MAKWADCCISAVRYDSRDEYIEMVRVHPDNGDSIGTPSDWRREAVVKETESGKSFVTITRSSDDKWAKGEGVRVMEANGREFLRTDANRTESDNLGDLPRF